MIKLDYTLKTPEERNELVKKILEEIPNPSPQYLEILADYLVLCMEKEEKKNRKLLTDNRLVTIEKRETSLENLITNLESGEDGIHNLIADNSKNTIFQPKITITKEDIENIPDLKELRKAIKYWEQKVKTLSGRAAYIAKQTLIDLRKDQYIIKNEFYKPVQTQKTFQTKHFIALEDTSYIKPDGTIVVQGISFLNPKVISAILCNYTILNFSCEGQFEGDLWYLMQDFNKLMQLALKPYPIYNSIVQCKIDGMQNIEIQNYLLEHHQVLYTVEYISTLWRNKIPKLISSIAEEQFLNFYYTGPRKKCTHCGQTKLAHNYYFSKNNSSKDGFYSICKKCRSLKGQKN